MTRLLPYNATLLLEGPDTIDLLDRVITCAVGNLDPGDTRPGALLTPQGKVIADFCLTRTENGCALAVHSDAVEALEKRLKLFRLRADVDISRQDGPAAEVDHAARIAAGQPAYGYDFADAEVFPTDINLDLFGGVAYNKGCFVGQEVVSRMYRRGKIRKRTVILKGDADILEIDVFSEQGRLGQISSFHDNMALAVLRIDKLAKALNSKIPILHAGNVELQPAMQDWLEDEMTALTAAENA